MTLKPETKYWGTIISAVTLIVTLICIVWAGATRTQRNESRGLNTEKEVIRVENRLDTHIERLDKRMIRMEDNQHEILKRLPK